MRLAIRLIFFFGALIFILIRNNSYSDSSIVPAEEPAHQSDVSFFEGRYLDRLNGYSIKQMGDDWKFSPSPNSNDLIKLSLTHKSGKYGLQVRVYNKGKLSFDEFVENYIKRFEKDMKNPELLDQGQFKGQGITGVAISFDGRQRNGYYLKSYVFPGKRFNYALQGGCSFKQKDTLEPELDKIAASFKTLQFI